MGAASYEGELHNIDSIALCEGWIWISYSERVKTKLREKEEEIWELDLNSIYMALACG